MSDSKVNILLVDDRPDGLYAMEAVLRCEEYNLVTASSGEEALRHFLRDDFAVVLLDVQMPGMDGFTAAKHMRRAQGLHKTPIIFVTAINVEDKYVYAGYESGAVDYLFKPFDPTILRSKVAVFVDMYKMHSEVQRQAELLREVERKDRERVLAELELESFRRYQNLADAVPHIVWKAEGDGTLSYFNKVWCDYTGLTLDQSTGKGWHSAIDQDDLEKVMVKFDEGARAGEPYEAECRIRRHDGAMRWHLMRTVPELTPAGNVVAWVGTSTDIHDRKLADEQRNELLRAERQARQEAEQANAKLREAEEELIRARNAAEDASRAKSQFLANMSHEIRTPLGVVLGFAELLLDPQQAEEERIEALRTIMRNGRQLSKLIDDILDISKVEAGRLEVESIPFSLRDVLTDLTTALDLKAREKGLELKVEVSRDAPATIVTDPTRLRQILTNVIGNAIKFTGAGWVKLTVKSDVFADQPGRAFLRFEVEDTGPGIAEDTRPRLFQDFMQGDSSTTRRYGGTGLGLALSRRLARLLGGDLVLEESREEHGCRFALWISCEVQEKAKADDATGLPATGKIRDLFRLDGLKVLLADDAPDNQLLVSRLLRRTGAEVTVADDGAAAVSLALAGEFDVILMDIQMPNVDGYEATRVLRDSGYKAPIIALTAHAMKEERTRCLERGFDDHLGKPIDYRELMQKMQRIATRKTGVVAPGQAPERSRHTRSNEIQG